MHQNGKPSCHRYGVVAILFLINLLNYADRFTIAGVLTDIQTFYNIDNDMAGLLQTVFIVFFMLFSPVCGFLGDRYSRKWIMVVGIIIWVCAVFASTFVPAGHFWLFMLLRGVVGIGEASYAVVSPSIIGDIFVGKERSRMLMVFYFAIPVGSGLGYVIGAKLSTIFGSWEWGMRLTPLIGLLSIILIILIVYEPVRGRNEVEKKAVVVNKPQSTSYFEDMIALIKIPTYVFSTLAYTALVFVTGTLSWWGPTAMHHAKADQENLMNSDDLSSAEKESISTKFGAVTMVGGIVGVSVGSILAEMLRTGALCFRPFKTDRAECIICAFGALIGTPTLLAALHLIEQNENLSYVLMFASITGLSFNWAINVDLQMRVVVPWRRNSSNAWQILISHLFGDASGPYLIGAMSDIIRGNDTSPKARFSSLLNAFYIPNAICLLSVVLFTVASFTVIRDQDNYKKEMGFVEGEDSKSSTVAASEGGIEMKNKSATNTGSVASTSPPESGVPKT